MKLLLDTHVLVWWMTDERRLGREARAMIENPANEVSFSAISYLEFAVKSTAGKISVPDDLQRVLGVQAIAELPLKWSHAERARSLPMIHSDPFDRALVAQAECEGMVLITRDSQLSEYGRHVMLV